MGITKQYLRYVHEATFGVIGSINADSVFVEYKKTRDRYIATAACENVIIWDSRTGNKELTFAGSKDAVTALCCHPYEAVVAVGYLNGSISCFRLDSGESNLVLNGHKAAVSCLAYDESGMRLASGGKDTEVVIWDVINEAGLFRLKGHKGVITCCQFFTEKNILITGSKDTLIKFWDLDTQHCFKTLVGHRTEIWSLSLLNNDSRLITGSGDSELRVYNIVFAENEPINNEPPVTKRVRPETGETAEEIDEEDETSILSCSKAGTILREGKDRVYSLKVDDTERVIACHGSDSLLELFQICNEEELSKRLRKKKKKQKSENIDAEVKLTLSDEIKRLNPIKASGKIRAFDIKITKNKAKVLCLLNNNSIEFHQLQVEAKHCEPQLLNSIRLSGHRSDVRTISVSSDNMSILTASSEAVKIWNRDSQQCVRTMPCDYALSSMFAPGDKYCVIATKTGKLQIFDIGSGELLESIAAHDKEVWSITMTSDLRGIVSGSADHDVKFWDFELIKDQDQDDEDSSDKQKRLTLVHQRTLKMTEEVLCVRVSKDLRLIAVSLLDNTVKVFFMDTLKFFLSLYGHKFPVLCMDISDDGTLIATGSADKNIKIWGLDFGDCHKSIFAHDESIMCLEFIPKTHMFFSAGKDKKVNQWDADNFQKITTLEGHQGEIWAMAISPSGNTVITASHDKSLRIWNKTEEPLVLEEEQELEREAEYEKSAVGEEPVVPGETNKETGLAGKKTLETVAAAEKIMEAIEIFNEEVAKKEEHDEECKRLEKEIPLPEVNPLMEAFNTTCPFRYVLEVIRRIKSSEIEEALLVLPFTYVADLLHILSKFLERDWETELSNRCLFFLMRVHCNQIIATHSLIPVIDRLRKWATISVNNLRDTVGFNLAGLKYIQREIDQREEVSLFTDASHKFKERRRRLKKKEQHILHIE